MPRFVLNGEVEEAAEGTVLASFLIARGASRKSVSGEPRGALCGMGICQECRVTIDGLPHQRACMVLVREGMEVAIEGA